jgi:hypothetical protein
MSDKKRVVRIPLGLVTNLLRYGSLYGRGPPSVEAKKKLMEILDENDLSLYGLKSMLARGDYSIVKKDK